MTQTAEKPTSKTGEKPEGVRRALITGGSSGLGEEFARQFARKGFDIVLAARRRDRMEKLAEELRTKHGVTVEVIEADLSKPEGVAAVAERLRKGDIHTLVNNAGFGTTGDFVNLSLERQLEEIDVNVRALTQLSHVGLEQLRQKGAGAIINVASTAAYQPLPYMATYGATKAYVLSLSEALHEEAAKYGVKVVCLCPGPVKTEFQEVARVDGEVLKTGWTSSKKVVAAAIGASESGSAIVTPGAMNKATMASARLFPRFVIRKVAGVMMKRGERKEA